MTCPQRVNAKPNRNREPTLRNGPAHFPFGIQICLFFRFVFPVRASATVRVSISLLAPANRLQLSKRTQRTESTSIIASFAMDSKLHPMRGERFEGVTWFFSGCNCFQRLGQMFSSQLLKISRANPLKHTNGLTWPSWYLYKSIGFPANSTQSIL